MTEPRFRHIEVLRTARVGLLGGVFPEDGSPDPNAPALDSVWYALHGYRQLAPRFLPRFAPVAGPRRLVVAPEGLSRFYLDGADRPHDAEDRIGASWMTREDRLMEIRDYVRYLDRTAREMEPRGGAGRPSPLYRTVLGFSQGAHTASRWALFGTVRPHRLILWGAGLPVDLPPDGAERLRGIDLVLVRGENDHLRNRREEEREEGWLEREGLPHRIHHHPGGHRVDETLLRALAEEEGRVEEGDLSDPR